MYDDINDALLKVQEIRMSINRDLVKYDQVKRLHDHAAIHGIDRTFLKLFDADLLNSVFKTQLPSYESVYDTIYDDSFIAATEGFLGNLASGIVNKIKAAFKAVRKAAAYWLDYTKYTKIKMGELKEKLDQSSFEQATIEYKGYTLENSFKVLKTMPINTLQSLSADIRKLVDILRTAKPDENKLNALLQKFGVMLSKFEHDVEALPELAKSQATVDRATLTKLIDSTLTHVTTIDSVMNELGTAATDAFYAFGKWGEDSTTEIAGGLIAKTTYTTNNTGRLIFGLYDGVIDLYTATLKYEKRAIRAIINLCDAAL